jgi:excisionase family DNA binding protein
MGVRCLPMEPLLHTRAEACQMLKISRATFYRLVEEGALKMVKIRNKTYVTDHDLRRYVGSLMMANVPLGEMPGRTYPRTYPGSWDQAVWS